MDETLAEHIRLSAERGATRDEIKERLLEAGWPASHVKPYIEKTFKQLEKGVLLRVHGAGKTFGEHTVLQDVNFDVNAGEIFGIIGVSGAGKTTLLNLLVGFLRPSQGDVLLATDDTTIYSVAAKPNLVKRKVGFSTQTPSFYSKLTVRENLEHFARLYGMAETDVRRRCSALMGLVGLANAQHVEASYLSGGMQKRLDIACALLHDPDILILDEPTADLDPLLRKQLWSLIKQINAKGTTIILASHFLAEIELLCDRIAILQNKKIIEVGTTQELRDIYSRKYEIFLNTISHDYDKLAKTLKQRSAVVTVEDDELVVQTPDPVRTLTTIASNLEKDELQSLHVARPTLGRVFESLVKQ